MHIRVTPGTMQPGKMGEATAVIGELFDRYRQSGGFRGGYLGGDDQSGEGIVVTLWDSEEAARTAVERNSATMAKLGPLSATGQVPVPPRAYEVLLDSESKDGSR